MPCYEAEVETKIVYVNGVDPQKINELTNKNIWYEAALCAIITELEKRGITFDVITKASKNGEIDLMKFWKEHSDEDKAKILNTISQLSGHEQEMLKKIINE